MSDIENLITNQNEVIEAMQQLFRNFKKDPADRKTPTYFKKRLETLEAYWTEFQTNHVKLCAFEERNYTYFSENYYEKAKTIYNQVKTTIQQTKSELYIMEAAPQNLTTQASETGTSGESSFPYQQQKQSKLEKTTDQTVSQGNASKTEEMLRKQRSNFKAFSRTIATVDLEEMKEKWEFEDTLKT